MNWALGSISVLRNETAASNVNDTRRTGGAHVLPAGVRRACIRILRGLALVLAGMAALAATPGSASRVSPMIVDIEPVGRNAIARIELTSESSRDIAYEVRMMKGDISPEGVLDLTPADDQFIVFPPQAIVEARSQQVFRIQYVGEEALTKSQVYYLSVKQIPVAFEEGENQVQVVVNFNVLVNVVPEGSEPVATVRSAGYVEREKQPDDPAAPVDPKAPREIERGIEVDLGNEGTRYFYAGRSDWKITARTVSGESYESRFTGVEMSKLIGTGVVAPDKNRIFFIPTEEALEPGSVAVEIEP